MLLILIGATIDLETVKGFTALGWACILGHRDVVFVLLQHGAIIDYPSFTEHKTPLMHAAYNGRDESVHLLLQVIFERFAAIFFVTCRCGIAILRTDDGVALHSYWHNQHCL